MRSPFNRSSLVRQLAGFMPAGSTEPADAPRQDLAERLGQWLNVADAIALHAAHPSIEAVGAQAAARPLRTDAGKGTAAPALRTELERVRATLVKSITARDARHTPDPDDLDTEYALYHQRYQDQQRRMEMSVDALRAHVRQTLARADARHAQLAALDAVMDQMLAGREQRLLHQVPAFLKARFQQLRQQRSTGPALDLLQVFNAEFEQTLLAELEHRLQPVVGLVESLDP